MRPRLGLLVSAGYPDGVPRLLERMVGWCEPVWAVPARDEVAAWFATSPAAADLDRAIASGRPVAVWASPDDVDDGVVTVGTSGSVDVVVPTIGVDAARIPPVTPFVRARWRARHGLPERLVVRATDVSDAVRPSAFALSSAVVVEGDPATLVEAMAWAAPCVTDADTASAIGADVGVDVLVADAGDRTDLAGVLADDQRRAAAVGRAGRRLVERGHDLTGAARSLANRLGLVAWCADDWRGRLDDDLLALGTPPAARIRARFEDAVAGLSGAAS